MFKKKKNNNNNNKVVALYKKIVVIKDFQVKNGVLGLDRDIYLSLIKFLDSLTVRKV
jgi:hypothetical protein